MGTPLTAAEFLRYTRVPSFGTTYLLGCLDPRVTVYSQQLRALNLVFALEQEGVVDRASRVAIVGGGIAGITAAAALISNGVAVDVFEKRPDGMLALQAGAHHRWIHPGVYDWPEPEWAIPAAARLPVLPWKAATADQLRETLLAGWQRVVDAYQAGDRVFVGNVKLGGLNGTRRTLEFQATTRGPKPGLAEYDVVILAVGFGIERTFSLAPRTSYWHVDPLHQWTPSGDLRCLVSGTGDGGLIDVLRALLREFDAEKIVGLLRDHCSAEMEDACARLRVIEQSADVAGDSLLARYLDIATPGVNELLRAQLRPHAAVVLIGQQGSPITRGASVLNRFLVSRLIQLNEAVTFVDGSRPRLEFVRGYLLAPGEVRSASAADPPNLQVQSLAGDAHGVVLSLPDGRHLEFSRLVVRHGAVSALQELDAGIYQACTTQRDAAGLTLKDLAQQDRTRYQLAWDSTSFWRASRMRVTPSVPPQQPLPWDDATPCASDIAQVFFDFVEKLEQRGVQIDATLIERMGDIRSEDITAILEQGGACPPWISRVVARQAQDPVALLYVAHAINSAFERHDNCEARFPMLAARLRDSGTLVESASYWLLPRQPDGRLASGGLWSAFQYLERVRRDGAAVSLSYQRIIGTRGMPLRRSANESVLRVGFLPCVDADDLELKEAPCGHHTLELRLSSVRTVVERVIEGLKQADQDGVQVLLLPEHSAGPLVWPEVRKGLESLPRIPHGLRLVLAGSGSVLNGAGPSHVEAAVFTRHGLSVVRQRRWRAPSLPVTDLRWASPASSVKWLEEKCNDHLPRIVISESERLGRIVVLCGTDFVAGCCSDDLMKRLRADLVLVPTMASPTLFEDSIAQRATELARLGIQMLAVNSLALSSTSGISPVGLVGRPTSRSGPEIWRSSSSNSHKLLVSEAIVRGRSEA